MLYAEAGVSKIIKRSTCIPMLSMRGDYKINPHGSFHFFSIQSSEKRFIWSLLSTEWWDVALVRDVIVLTDAKWFITPATGHSQRKRYDLFLTGLWRHFVWTVTSSWCTSTFEASTFSSLTSTVFVTSPSALLSWILSHTSFLYQKMQSEFVLRWNFRHSFRKKNLQRKQIATSSFCILIKQKITLESELLILFETFGSFSRHLLLNIFIGES